MTVQDELNGNSLSYFLQNLAANRATGTLRIRWRDLERYLRFEDGTIAALSFGPRKALKIRDHLVQRGYAELDALNAALQRGKRQHKTTIRAILDAGLMSAEELQAAVGEFISEQIYDLMLVREAEYAFTQGDPPPLVFGQDTRALGLRLDPCPMLFEGARRADQWKRIHEVVSSERDVFVLLQGWDNLELDPLTAEVAQLLDGSLDIIGVLKHVPAPRFEVMKSVSELVNAGAARPSSPEEIDAAARDALEDGDVEHAIRLLRHALELDANHPELRQKLAETLEAMGKSADAATEFARLGYQASRDGETEIALEHYEHAAQLNPNDVVLHERRVDLLRQQRDLVGLAAGVLELAAVYVDLGTADRAGALLRAGVEHDGLNDPLILERLAEVEVSLGHLNEAAGIFETLADRCEDGAVTERLQYLRRALEQVPDDDEIVAQVHAIETVRRQRRRSVRRRVLTAAACGTLVLSTLVVGTGELIASRGIVAALDRGLGLGSLADAPALTTVAELQDIQESWGWTPSGKRAERMLHRLVDMHLESAGKLTDNREYHRADYLLRELDRAVRLAPLGAACDSLRRQVLLERKAHNLLEGAVHTPDSQAATESALATLDNPELLDFHLRRLPELKEPRPMGLVLRALTHMESPRIAPAVAVAFPNTDDEDCSTLMRGILARAPELGPRHGPAWDETYQELEQALEDPARSVRAREALALLRGNDAKH